MILGIDPEDGNCRHVMVAFDLCREFQGGECLEQREERSAEEPGLLAREDGDRLSIGQLARRFDGFGRCPASGLLCGEDRGNAGPVARVRLRARDGGGPGGTVGRVAGKEGFDRVEIVGVIGREPADPGEAADIDCHPGGRLSGSARKQRRFS
ncbi:MAG: hypothetical protein QM736_18700 [Vicinamibacterales bacterium]